MNGPIEREREIVALLEEWPWEPGTTLIGGYALAAYGAARYSEDIDFVISKDAHPRIEAWLRGRGFGPVPKHRPPSAQTFNDAVRLIHGDVTLDLLVGYVRDREARVEIPEEWISARPRKVQLDLLTSAVSKVARVARPEALWALKLQAGRDQDLTDLFAIAAEPVSSAEVRALFESLRTTSLLEKLACVETKLHDTRIYDDARSRLGL